MEVDDETCGFAVSGLVSVAYPGFMGIFPFYGILLGIGGFCELGEPSKAPVFLGAFGFVWVFVLWMAVHLELQTHFWEYPSGRQNALVSFFPAFFLCLRGYSVGDARGKSVFRQNRAKK